MRSVSPALSVCVPTYNSADYIDECLDSVVEQELESFEVVVVDNCSSDDTFDKVRQRNDSRIKLFRNDSNIGAVRNFNRTLDLASGSFVKLLCADDILRPGLLHRQWSVLAGSPVVSLATCDFQLIDEFGVPGTEVKCLQGRMDGSSVIQRCMRMMTNVVGGPSNVMFRKSEIRFDPSYRWVSDFKFAMDHLRRGELENVNITGYSYRRHPNTDSSTISSRVRLAENIRLQIEYGYQNPVYVARCLLKGETSMSDIPREYWTLRSIVNAARLFVGSAH